MTGKANPDLKPFDDLMIAFVTEQGAPGAALAVTKDGRLVYARGFGLADRKTREPVEPTSLFRIASISKPVTAVAVLQLVERGKLKLDDKIFSILKHEPFLPEGAKVDPRLDQITILHLLRHTAGFDKDASLDPMFRSVQFAGLLGVEPPAKPDHIIRVMRGRPLDFDPGQRYAYSNFGYCLLGRAVEAVTGQAYEAYVRDHVLAPLGITRLRIGKTLPAGRVPGEVRYYDEKARRRNAVLGERLGKPVATPYGSWYLEAMDAHGGWIASAVGLVRFASAFDRPAKCPILSAASIRAMFARPEGLAGHDEEGKPRAAYYGCGWRVRPVGRKANHWHTGGFSGTSTLLVRRHDGLNWAVLFNTRSGPAGKALASMIDPLVHRAANAVKTWPTGDLFDQLQ